METEENEVIGFQCNATAAGCNQYDELHMCINTTLTVEGYSLEKFLNQTYQHKLNKIHTNFSDDQCIRNSVNLKILSDQEFATLIGSSEKDEAFVALIPSGSIIYCIFGVVNECRHKPVLDGVATKYVIKNSPMSCGRRHCNMFTHYITAVCPTFTVLPSPGIHY